MAWQGWDLPPHQPGSPTADRCQWRCFWLPCPKLSPVIISNAWTPTAPGTAGRPPPSHRAQSNPQTPRDLQLRVWAGHSSWEGDPSPGVPAMPHPCGVMEESIPSTALTVELRCLGAAGAAVPHGPGQGDTGTVPPTSHLSQLTPSQPRAPSCPRCMPADVAEALPSCRGEEPGGTHRPSPPDWVGSPPSPCRTLHRGLWRCRACPHRAWGEPGGLPPAPLCSFAPGRLAGANTLFTPTQLLKTPQP